jgi:hypothetical protein
VGEHVLAESELLHPPTRCYWEVIAGSNCLIGRLFTRVPLLPSRLGGCIREVWSAGSWTYCSPCLIVSSTKLHLNNCVA